MRSTQHASRGLLAIVAAGAVGAGLVVGSGVAPASAAANLTLDYTCTYPLINQQDLTVDITVDLPAQAQVGVPTAPFDIEAISTVSANTTSGLTLIGAKTIEGSAISHVNVQAPQVDLPDLQVPVTIPQTPVPASGAFDIPATGDTPSLTFPEAGEGTIDIGDIDLRMIARNAAGEPIALPGGHSDGSFDAPCTVNPGQDQRLATLPIVGEPAPTCDGLPATITGTGTINGTAGDDVIVGSSGADTINGRAGDDTICAGGGNDLVNGGRGSDTEYGGGGDDRFIQGATANGADLLVGQAGTDTVAYPGRTTPLTVTLAASATGNDGAPGEGDNLALVESVVGGSGADTITGDAKDNTIIGRAGNDILTGSTGADRLIGGDGDDTLRLRDNVSRNDRGNGGNGGGDTDIAIADPGDILTNVP